MRRRSRRTEKQSGFLSMKNSQWENESLFGCFKVQFSLNNAPKKEFLPALANVVEVVSKTLPPTLNLTLSLGIFMVKMGFERQNFETEKIRNSILLEL